MKHLILPFLIATGIACAQTPTFHFSPDPQSLGTIEQGETRHVVLNGVYQGTAPIQLENVISQNVGASNFKYPKTMAPKGAAQIEFDLNTAGMVGPFTHQIILISTNGTPYPTSIEGTVESPILFSQGMLDAGYVDATSKPQWTIYAYSPKGTKFQLTLDAQSTKKFSLQTTPVQLNIEKFDEIKEGGNIPGLKLILTAKNFGKGPENPKIKSIREIVGFTNTAWPKATPEVLVIGFWK